MTESTAVPTAGLEALAEQVARVAALRRNVAALSATYRAKREAFDADTADLCGLREAEEADLAAAERTVCALALSHYEATQDKAPTLGVAIKLFESLDYDPDAAFAWAKEKQMALVPESLDRKAFERIAKATSLPFVSVSTEARAQIARDLDKALGGVA